MTPRQQIVDNTKKSMTIATSLIQKNLEGLGNCQRENRDNTINQMTVIRIEGLIDFLKNELELYQKNMDSYRKVEAFTNQLNKGE